MEKPFEADRERVSVAFPGKAPSLNVACKSGKPSGMCAKYERKKHQQSLLFSNIHNQHYYQEDWIVKFPAPKMMSYSSKIICEKTSINYCLPIPAKADQKSCSCTRQCADELAVRFPSSGDGSYTEIPATFAQHFIDEM